MNEHCRCQVTGIPFATKLQMRSTAPIDSAVRYIQTRKFSSRCTKANSSAASPEAAASLYLAICSIYPGDRARSRALWR